VAAVTTKVTIAEGLAAVRARIPANVKLVAVSKTKPPEAVREAYAAGQRAFGENYAQELVAKAEALADLPDIEWHFIGHLQTNKAKYVAKVARVVHTIDSAALARELGKRAAAAGRVVDALIEVNVSGEAQKYGVAPGDILEVMDAVRGQAALRLAGLMTMPPADDLEAARRVFATLSSLRSLHGGPAVLPELSMGMSGDLDVAIAAGATLVRVGSAVFGAREYP
jgi:pyridoxal phosphate enzyme (YggS family)